MILKNIYTHRRFLTHGHRFCVASKGHDRQQRSRWGVHHKGRGGGCLAEHCGGVLGTRSGSCAGLDQLGTRETKVIKALLTYAHLFWTSVFVFSCWPLPPAAQLHVLQRPPRSCLHHCAGPHTSSLPYGPWVGPQHCHARSPGCTTPSWPGGGGRWGEWVDW